MGTTKKVKSTITAANIAYAPVPVMVLSPKFGNCFIKH